MKRWILGGALLCMVQGAVCADHETNASKHESIEQKHLEEQMQKEKKYAKERAFYQGSEYNLKDTQIDEKSLSKVPVIEPEYDFDMDDVYD